MKCSTALLRVYPDDVCYTELIYDDLAPEMYNFPIVNVDLDDISLIAYIYNKMHCRGEPFR